MPKVLYEKRGEIAYMKGRAQEAAGAIGACLLEIFKSATLI